MEFNVFKDKFSKVINKMIYDKTLRKKMIDSWSLLLYEVPFQSRKQADKKGIILTKIKNRQG